MTERMSRSEVKKDLLKKSDLVLDELSSLEPAQNEVCASFETETKIVYEVDDFLVSSSHESALFGIRSILDEGKLGFTTTNSSREDSLKAAAREAQQIAKLSIPSAHHQTAENQTGETDFEIGDRALQEMSPAKFYEAAEFFIEKLKSDPRVAIDRVEMNLSSGSSVIANSKGVRRSVSETSCGFLVMGMAKTEAEVTSFDYDYSSVMTLSRLEAEIQNLAGHFQSSVLGSLGANKGKTYKGKVLLHPYVVSDFLGSLISLNCNALQHQDNVAPWKGKVGESVISPLISVHEDPLDEELEHWSPFDREGVLTRKNVLIDAGKLSHIGHTCFTAHRGGQKVTGNAVGGPGGLPSVGFLNETIMATREAVPVTGIEKELGSGLVLKRFSGNMDPISGHFSGVAKNSWWVEGGERTHAVHEVMISGNLYEIFNQVLAISKETSVIMGSGRAPYILVDGVSVTAN